MAEQFLATDLTMWIRGDLFGSTSGVCSQPMKTSPL